MQDGKPAAEDKGKRRATQADRLIGRRIMALRKAKGLSQTALGQALGVSFQQVQKYEKGTNRLSVGALQAIAGILEVPITSLCTEQAPVSASEAREPPDLLRVPGALDLLRSYAAIPRPALRRDLLALARSIADHVAN